MTTRSTQVGPTARFGAGMLALALISCGGPGGLEQEDAGGGEAEEPDASSLGQPGDDCERASECEGDLVCDPGAQECADSLACEEHEECGLGSHCADGGQCAPSDETSPCADDDNCQAGDECIGGFCACSGETFQAELVDVNMLILLDRSGSMRANIEGDELEDEFQNPDSRWQIARRALDSVLDVYEDQLNLGFALYPAVNSICEPGEVFVPVSEDTTESDILGALGDNPPPFSSQSGDAFTPSGPSLESVGEHPPLSDPDAENVILYLTDGEENCGGSADDPPEDGEGQASAAESLLSQGIRTFVVGFSEDVGADELNATAEAGGTAREDSDDGLSFYLATDETSLEDALADVAGEALACTYDLDNAPSDLDKLHVYADNQSVIRDPDQEDGWDYDASANQLTLYGPACDDLRAGEVEELAIVQTCDLVVE